MIGQDSHRPGMPRQILPSESVPFGGPRVSIVHPVRPQEWAHAFSSNTHASHVLANVDDLPTSVAYAKSDSLQAIVFAKPPFNTSPTPQTLLVGFGQAESHTILTTARLQRRGKVF